MKPLVQVTWNDAQDHGESWVGLDDAEAFGDVSCTIISVGFLVKKTDKYVTIAGDWEAADADYGRVTKIPAAWVISLKELSCAESSSPAASS